MKYVLRPFGLGSESLKPFYIDSSVPQSFVLGRNIETGLDKAGLNVNHVSRNHVSVTVRDGKVMMSPIARQDNIVSFKGSACSRGEHEMAVNDEFSLLGSIQFFNYRLEVDTAREITSSGSRKRSRHSAEVDEDAEEVLAIDEPLVKRVSSRGSVSVSAAEVPEIDLTSPNIKRTSSRNASSMRIKEEVVRVLSSSSNSNDIDENNNKDQTSDAAEATTSVSVKSESAAVLREFECAICYETMASVCTLVPCGDNFCFSCIADWSAKSKACPLCQGPFELNNCVSNKLLDNVIRSTLQAAGEDVAAWEKRVAEGIEQRKRLLGGAPAETNKQTPRYAHAPPPPPVLVPVQTYHPPMYFPTAPVPPPTLAPLFGSSAMMANVRQAPAARRRRGGANNTSSVVDLT